MEFLKKILIVSIVLGISGGTTFYIHNYVKEEIKARNETKAKQKTIKEKPQKKATQEIINKKENIKKVPHLKREKNQNLENFLSQTYDNVIDVHNEKEAANQIINTVYNEYDKKFDFTNDKTRFNFIFYPNKDILILKIETQKKKKLEQYRNFLHRIKKKFEKVERPIQLSIGINNSIKRRLKKNPNKGLDLIEQEIREIKRRSKKQEYIEEKKKYTTS